jgi:hypothetical protein
VEGAAKETSSRWCGLGTLTLQSVRETREKNNLAEDVEIRWRYSWCGKPARRMNLSMCGLQSRTLKDW